MARQSEIEIKIWRKKKKLLIPIRYAKAAIRYAVFNNKTYHGAKSNVKLRFSIDDSSEVSDLEFRLAVKDSRNKNLIFEKVLKMKRGEYREIEVPLGVGSYELNAVIISPKVLRNKEANILPSNYFNVDEKYPAVNVRKIVSHVYYPKGGYINIILDKKPDHYNVAKIVLNGRECSFKDNGPTVNVECQVSGLPESVNEYTRNNGSYGLSYRLGVRLSYDDKAWGLESSVWFPVMLDEEYRRVLSDRIEKLVAEALDENSRESILSHMERLTELGNECKVASLFDGLDCGVISEALKRLGGIVSDLRKRAKAIGELGKDRLVDMMKMYLDMHNKCSTPRYRDLDVCADDSLAGLGRKVLSKVAEAMTEMLDKGELEKALEIYGYASQLCELGIVGTGKDCGTVERIGTAASDIMNLLRDGITVEFPRGSASRRFKARVRVSYEGSTIVRDVFVDFSKAEEYVIVKDNVWKFKLPTIFPGIQLDTQVAFEAKFNGRISIPYSKCFKNYCVDETKYVNVKSGTLASSAELSVGRALFVGRPVTEIAKLKPAPIAHVPLAKHIKIGEYVCVGKLGEGGFAVTLYCEHSSYGSRAVAKIPEEFYKQVLEGSTVEYGGKSSARLMEEIKMFDREAKILRKLDHPNIIKLIDQGTDPIPYLMFTYCTYGDLRKSVLDRVSKPIDVVTALKIMIPIADALEYGHKNNVLHLDVKPSNILLDERFIPLLSDYNIGHIMKTVSVSSRRKGFTRGFAAPEQVNPFMEKPDQRADIFGHAATLYYLITRRHPYPIDYWMDNFRNTEASPVPPSRYVRGIPGSLDEVLSTALQINPDDRYESMGEYLRDLLEAYEEVAE